MHYISENTVQDLVKQDDINDVISKAFAALAWGDAACFPIVRETLGYADAVFGFKSGFDRRAPLLGVKAGGLWPGNIKQGIANHQSTVLLFDENSGAPRALIRATHLTALRTAAASALSIRHLARKDATTLGIVGAGGQGAHQLKAALKERTFEKVVVHDPSERNAQALAAEAKKLVMAADIAEPEALADEADVIITITPSRKPILKDSWIRQGTHLACMGADTAGKQEIETALVKRATLFGDVAEQAVLLGECQHASAAGFISADNITCLGDVINGVHPGRNNEEDVTLFDSTGMALQDLAAAQLVLDIAMAEGAALALDA